MANSSDAIENQNKLCVSSTSVDKTLDILFRESSFSQIKSYFAQPNISVQPDTRLNITDRTKYENASAEQKVRISIVNCSFEVMMHIRALIFPKVNCNIYVYVHVNKITAEVW